MTDYTKLVRALRYCVKARNCEKCAYRINNNSVKCRVQRVEDAADAIEKITAMYEKAEMDATNLTGKLAQAEAEVERLKDSNEELREKQTYIDHYGDKWMTSAKDVPTAAYKHGYMDGMDEAKMRFEAANRLLDHNTIRCEELRKQLREAHENYEKHLNELESQLPKHGEWVRKESENIYWFECSECGGHPMRDTWDGEGKLTDFCPRCGADMRAKMEVQDADK